MKRYRNFYLHINKILYLICLTALMFCLFGCSNKVSQKDKTLRVGVVLYTKDDPYINALTSCLKQYFEELENDDFRINMTVKDGKNDQSEQDEIVEGMIDAGCDILCIALVDRTAPSKIIEMAKKEDIPIIFFNREPVREDLMKWDKLYYIGADAEQSGVMQGELVSDLINSDKRYDKNGDGKIQYVLLEGEAGHQDAIIRTDMVVKTLRDNGVELEKLSNQFANWNRAQAENKMTQLIELYGTDIELVLSNNDEMALGAVNAYELLGYTKSERPPIFGIDGLEDALLAVDEGTIQGTVYNDKEGQAYEMANLAVSLFRNSSLSEYDFKDGKYIILSYRKVDSANIDEYLKR